jgi:hypothetical protein
MHHPAWNLTASRDVFSASAALSFEMVHASTGVQHEHFLHHRRHRRRAVCRRLSWAARLSIRRRLHAYSVKQETAMNRNNQARLSVAALVYLMVIGVVFGVGLISVLMTPALAQHAFFWIPAIIVTSLLLSAPLAWSIAPSMMMRFNPVRRIH